MSSVAEALRCQICRLEQELLAPAVVPGDVGEAEDETRFWTPPPRCVPIRADVREFDFAKLASAQKEVRGTRPACLSARVPAGRQQLTTRGQLTGRLFDVIMTDPPWQLATANPTRGVAIGYDQLSDTLIQKIPFASLQDNGFLFMWVINAKYRFALSLLQDQGYELVDEITWVKQTVNRRLAKSHGFYLQHAKETCLVARKGKDPPNTRRNLDASDVILAERRGQSQKPEEIYRIIERLVPAGSYLEVFARRNNLRDGWVSIGNEL
jgi:mRNA (2'-O-methyladenosine-N6-)-methyltransferase